MNNPDHITSVADPGLLSRIPDPTFFHTGSRIRTVSIADPGSSSKNLSILTPKKQKNWFLSSKKYDPGCSSRIRMLTFSHPGSRIQGLKRHRIPDPGSGSATLHITMELRNNFLKSLITDFSWCFKCAFLVGFVFHSTSLTEASKAKSYSLSF